MQSINGFRPFHIIMNISLICCKKYGKRRQHAGRRFPFIYIRENLGICNDQFRRSRQNLQCSGELVCCHTHDPAFFIQQFSQSLNLWKDQTSFRCLDILRHDQKDQITGRNQITCDHTVSIPFRYASCQVFLYFLYPLSCYRADTAWGYSGLFFYL